jgi:membrane protein implicated in regulation of membrane protease activity
MSKEIWIVVLGILIAAVPFLGFPGSWKTVIYVFVGLVIASLAFLLQLRKTSDTRNSSSKNGRQTDVYVENSTQVLEENRTHNEQEKNQNSA